MTPTWNFRYLGVEAQMSGIPRRLKQLEKQLASLDGDEAMLLTELDGFLASGCVWSAHSLGSNDERP
jgi:hypothetical protein